MKNESEHIEAGKERMQKDESDVEAIADQFRRFDVFREDANLYCISTNECSYGRHKSSTAFRPESRW